MSSQQVKNHNESTHLENILNISIPHYLIKDREIILPKYFRYDILDIRVSSAGNIYCLTNLWFNFIENGKEDRIGANIVSVFDSSHNLINQVVLDELKLLVEKVEKEGKVENAGDTIRHMALLNGDLVVFFSEKNRTFIYDGFLKKRVHEFNLAEPIFPTIKRPDEDIYKYNFVSDAAIDIHGRMFCSIREKVPNNFSFAFSVIAYAGKDYSFDKGHKPILNYITHLGNPYLTPDQKIEKKNDLINKMGLKNSATNYPSLLDQIKEKYNMSIYGPWLGSPVPLNNNKILIPVYHKGMRGGTRGCEFLFAILNIEGELIGRLEDMHKFEDTPYTGWHCNIYYDTPNDRILYKNCTAFYIFNTDGKLLKKISLEDGDLKYLRKFRLEGITSSGELFFYQPDQYTLIKAQPFINPERAEEILIELIVRYKTSMRDAKKKFNPNDYHWVNEGTVSVL